MYEFEPYKVWPRVQTDSLIFRMCKRSATSTLPDATQTVYLRSISRKVTLLELLDQYKRFDPDDPLLDKDLKYKISPLQNSYQKLASKHSSFSFVLPAASCLDELNEITADYPRLCDGENNGCAVANEMTPLNWNRGPNTNPVYSLVVRTKWARQTFGEIACARYLKPCFYWNGKTIASRTGGGKEGEFWRKRDPLRLGKKEMSAAEAYWPYCSNLDMSDPTTPFYSLIMVNKDDASDLEREMIQHGHASPMAALFQYLRDARNAFQGDKLDTVIAHCQYNRCGTEVPVKIIHPINCGYNTKSQPRQRFFVDYTRSAVTNQCIYFTIKPAYPCQSADYYCGLLNSALLQFFVKVHCSYDQQGRMRFFGRLMASIPFAPPPSEAFTEQVAMLAQGLTEARTWIYTFVRHTPGGQRLMERVRNCEWHLSPKEVEILHQFSPPPHWTTLQPDTSLSTPTSCCPPHLSWIKQHIVLEDPLTTAAAAADTIEHVFITLLKIASLFQYAVDQMVYAVYKIPHRLQLEVEEDLNLSSFRKEWEGYNNDLDFDEHDPETWHRKIMDLAKSFTKEKNLNIDLTASSSSATPLPPSATPPPPPPIEEEEPAVALRESIEPLPIVDESEAVELNNPRECSPPPPPPPAAASSSNAEPPKHPAAHNTTTSVTKSKSKRSRKVITPTGSSTMKNPIHTPPSAIPNTTPVTRNIPFSIQQAISMIHYDDDDEEVDELNDEYI